MIPFGRRCPNVAALRGKRGVTSNCRLASVASLAPRLWSSLILDLVRGLNCHHKQIHSADLLRLQTSSPACTPAQVQGSVHFHTFLGHDDRMLQLRFGRG
jgi:hypothetical protein